MKLRDLGQGIRFGTLAVGMLFVAFAVLAALMPAQNDTFWHLRAGQDIWRAHQIPRVDHYSHTFAGAPWPDHEWLTQAGMYLVHRAGGMAGLELAAAALVLSAAAITWRLMVGAAATRMVPMTIGLLLSSCVWVLRPVLVSDFLLSVLVFLLVRERYALIPLLFLGWANAHGGVVLGGLVLAAAWAAAVLCWWRARTRENRRRVLVLTPVVLLSGLACAAAPLGFGIYRFVIESTARSMALRIDEWFPVAPTDLFGVLFWAAVLVFVALVVARRRAFIDGEATWADWVVVAAAVALLPLAARSLRNTAPFVLLAAPAANRLMGAQFRFRRPAWLARGPRAAPAAASPDHPRLNLALLGGMVAAAAAFVGLAFRAPPDRLNWRPFSDAALAAARACDGPLYNHYDDGGTLIWFLPEKPVFVDGRQDPYPLPFLLEFAAVEAGQAPHQPLFDRFHIRCAVLPTKSITVAALDREGWTTRFRDGKWSVQEAPPAAASTAAGVR